MPSAAFSSVTGGHFAQKNRLLDHPCLCNQSALHSTVGLFEPMDIQSSFLFPPRSMTSNAFKGPSTGYLVVSLPRNFVSWIMFVFASSLLSFLPSVLKTFVHISCPKHSRDSSCQKFMLPCSSQHGTQPREIHSLHCQDSSSARQVALVSIPSLRGFSLTFCQILLPRRNSACKTTLYGPNNTDHQQLCCCAYSLAVSRPQSI